MSGIAINDVQIPGHVEWPIKGAGPQGESDFLFEVYTGNVVMHFPGGSQVTRKDFSIYLPLRDNTIRTYGDNRKVAFESAVLVTPIGFQAKEDEEFLCSVDAWELAIVPRTFPGVGGKPMCLVLNFSLAIMNGNLFRIGYNVTLSTPRGLKLDSLDLKPDASP
jgi:hypothetical protein